MRGRYIESFARIISVCSVTARATSILTAPTGSVASGFASIASGSSRGGAAAGLVDAAGLAATSGAAADCCCRCLDTSYGLRVSHAATSAAATTAAPPMRVGLCKKDIELTIMLAARTTDGPSASTNIAPIYYRRSRHAQFVPPGASTHLHR